MNRLLSAKTSHYVSMQSTPAERQQDMLEKREFFSGAVLSSWATESQKLRAKVDADYKILRNYER